LVRLFPDRIETYSRRGGYVASPVFAIRRISTEVDLNLQTTLKIYGESLMLELRVDRKDHPFLRVLGDALKSRTGVIDIDERARLLLGLDGIDEMATSGRRIRWLSRNRGLLTAGALYLPAVAFGLAGIYIDLWWIVAGLPFAGIASFLVAQESEPKQRGR
jgi:hypothetical protein